ncbi:hypothetical protein J4216_03025 [Candidatus Woesearchaeota archaeon]|nr:hypothetical protein [Candidatus Woesearchaeota archaeon]
MVLGFSKKERIESQLGAITYILSQLNEIFGDLVELNQIITNLNINQKDPFDVLKSERQLEALKKRIKLIFETIRKLKWDLFSKENLVNNGFNINEDFSDQNVRNNELYNNERGFLKAIRDVEENEVKAVDVLIESTKLLKKGRLSKQVILDTIRSYKEVIAGLEVVIGKTIDDIKEATSGQNHFLSGIRYSKPYQKPRFLKIKRLAAVAALAGAIVTASNVVQRHAIGAPAATETREQAKNFKIAGKNYQLKQRTIYVAADRRSALTLLLGPQGSEQALKELDQGLYNKLMRTGHISILFIDPSSGELMVSEQLGQTKFYPIERSEVGKKTAFKDAGVDLYEVRGLNFAAVAATAKFRGKNPKKFGVNQSCTTHAEDMLDAGGLNLRARYIAVPMRGVVQGNRAEENTLAVYLKTFAPALSDAFIFVIAKFKDKDSSRVSVSEFSEYAVPGINGYTALHNQLVEFYNAFPYLVGMDVVIPHTPSGFVLTGIETGYLKYTPPEL